MKHTNFAGVAGRATLIATLMCAFTAALAATLAMPGAARAQNVPPAGPLPPVNEQIVAAVLPLPPEMRAAATVMGYRPGGKLEVVRPGTNGMTCLALYVIRSDFHVACYHESLEPFMARGRALREAGVAGAQVDEVRFSEVKNGKIKMPAYGSLYSLTARAKSAWDPATGKVENASQLTVLYIPFATAESTGLPTKPQPGPWLMFPGTAKAHVMMIGAM